MEIDDAILDYFDEVEGGLYGEAENLLLLADQLPYQKLAKGYSVHIPDSDDPKHPVYSVDVVHLSNKLVAFCHCSSFKKHKKCKHAVAAVLFLKEELDVYDPSDELFDEEEFDDFEISRPPAQRLIDKKYEGSKKKAEIKNSEQEEDGFFFFQMDPINVALIYTLAGGVFKITNNDVVHKVKPVVTNSPHHKFNFKESSKQVFSIDIIFDGKNGFRTKCSCHQKTFPLCHHIGSCLLYMNEYRGPHYFKQFKDHTEAKNQFLKKYGLTVDDPEAKYFEFGFDSYKNPERSG